MALQVCKNCTTRYAPAAVCPQCGENEWLSEEEADVAKANQQGQSTIYVGEGEPVPDNVPEGVRLVGPGAPEEADAVDKQMEQDLQEEGEQPSAGSSSEASPSKTGSSDSSSSASPSSPAPTTAPPSSTATASGAAPTTAGSTPATTSPTSTQASDK